ncbi:MAG: hypothetical protein IKR48_00005, partial [Kiritimatiellae bacterium]|nr:hypothetical protein [Kiritimatiellia bacterium]
YYPGQGGTPQAYESLANTDSDGDGFPAWQEFLLETDPTNAASHLYLTIQMNGNTPVVGWSVTNNAIESLGYRYILKGKSSLSNATDWQPVTNEHHFFKLFVEPLQ